MWKFSLHDSQASRYGPLEKLFGENDTLPLHSGVVNRAPYCSVVGHILMAASLLLCTWLHKWVWRCGLTGATVSQTPHVEAALCCIVMHTVFTRLARHVPVSVSFSGGIYQVNISNCIRFGWFSTVCSHGEVSK